MIPSNQGVSTPYVVIDFEHQQSFKGVGKRSLCSRSYIISVICESLCYNIQWVTPLSLTNTWLVVCHDMNLNPPDSFITVYPHCNNHMDGLLSLGTTRCL